MRHRTHKPTGLRIRFPHTTPQTIVVQNDLMRPKYGWECNVEDCFHVKASTLPSLGDAQIAAREHQRMVHS